MLQYIGPAVQFTLGVWLFHEPVAGPRLVGFMLIWLAPVIYTAESLLSLRRRRLGESAKTAAPDLTESRS